jgi:hypothetical protein
VIARTVSAAILLATVFTRVGGAVTPPWSRTETREPCASFDPLRQPFFGDLHVHTSYSADAYIFGTRIKPQDAYAFARGAAIPLPDETEAITRSSTIDRPLDFMAVTDHAEWFGEVDVCTTPGSPVYEVDSCRFLRSVEATGQEEFNTTVNWLFPVGIPNPPTNLPFCATPGVDCDAAAISVWQAEQAAAEEAYDRTAACGFTSFIGFEHTPSPLGRHRHRNVIFRNHIVPRIALSHLDTLPGGVPQGLWNALGAQCTEADTGCDAVIIPHNSNLSGGEQFIDPVDAADAFRRQTFEPLVEIHQIKGNSECRYDRLAGAGVGTNDELCTFEQDPEPHQGPDATEVPIGEYPRRNMVRPTLEDGLGFEQTIGVNPFKFGFVGATDTHDGNAGDVSERDWPGAQGRNDGSQQALIRDNLRTNPGGVTVVWAEENSRDAIFSALRRRETYATSGTRPVVRFFGGSLDGVTCGAPDFLARAYATGTPMGGDLGAVRGSASPRFAVLAMKDPGTASQPGVDLQRVQIIKGWVDPDGTPHEQVFDVAGNPANGASVDPATCETTGSGDAELCAVWEDPAFDPTQRAFYYVRVLENPVCRWSTRLCKQVGVDPFAADCAAQAAVADPAFADCCLAGNGTDRFLTPTIQERAWTSPIWYRPEAIARLRARLTFGKRAGRDTVTLRANLNAMPTGFDPTKDGLTIRVSDDDDVFVVQAPALKQRGKRFTFKTRSGGTRSLTLAQRKKDVLLVVTGRKVDLAAAAREDHPITVTIEGGLFRSVYTRTWTLDRNHLSPEGS